MKKGKLDFTSPHTHESNTQAQIYLALCCIADLNYLKNTSRIRYLYFLMYNNET
jgi:hypothetical protein